RSASWTRRSPRSRYGSWTRAWIPPRSPRTCSGRARRRSTTSVRPERPHTRIRPVVHSQGVPAMAIEVRIPTILRSYTGGAKTVEGTGDTLTDLLTDLDTRHSGLRARLITDQGGLHRFVNVYVNDEDVRF